MVYFINSWCSPICRYDQMGNFLLDRLELPTKTIIEQLPLVVPPSITIVASTFNRRFTVEKKPQRTISLTPISRRNYGRENPLIYM